MALRNLVFQGGGVKGLAYAGAIEVLEQRGMLRGVTHVAGTSAGSITAALLAVGITSQELNQVLTQTSFSSFLDGGWGVIGDAKRLLEGYGVYKGDVFESWLQEQLATLTKQLTGTAQPGLTFGQLRELASKYPGVCRELYVVTTNLSRQMPEVFCADSRPDVAIAQAVRMSMSIPLFFEAVQFEGNVYVDGGVSWNYPIDLFDGVLHRPALGLTPRRIARDRKDPAAIAQGTLGFSLGTAAEIESERQGWTPLPVTISNLEGLVKGLFSFMLEESTRLHLDEGSLRRTVFIDDAGVPTTDFELTPAQMETLVANGRQATAAYLDSGHQQRLGGTVASAG